MAMYDGHCGNTVPHEHLSMSDPPDETRIEMIRRLLGGNDHG